MDGYKSTSSSSSLRNGHHSNGNGHGKNGTTRSIPMDPELEAEIFYAHENGLVPPKSLISDDLKKVAQALAEDPMDKLAEKVTRSGNGTGKAERKARSRGVSGCSIKKDGLKFEYGLTEDCIDRAYNDPFSDGAEDSDSDAEYDEYADYVFKYSDKEIRSIVEDYLLNGNKEEALASLEKFKITNDTLSRMTKDLVQMSVEGPGGGGTIELGSKLLQEVMHQKWISTAALIDVLKEVVESLEELSIDTPKIVEGMAVFMAKLVEQRVLTIEILKMMANKEYDLEESESKVAKQCYEDALTFAGNRTLLAGKCISNAGHQPVDVLSTQFKLILTEYLHSNDKVTASKRVEELNVPHYSHDFVLQAGVLALEKMNDGVMVQLSLLLKDLKERGVLMQSCLQKGFERLFDALGDLYYDLPAAHTLAQRWVDKCVKAGIIVDAVAKKCPAPVRSRSRTLSEGADGKLSCLDENGRDIDSLSDNLNESASGTSMDETLTAVERANGEQLKKHHSSS